MSRLITIMLGRLQMTVDDCIQKYEDMVDEVFKKSRLPLTFRGKVRGRFNTDVLTRKIQEVIEQAGLSVDTKFRHSDANTCKVYVQSLQFARYSVSDVHK
jgi:hypothetical protein